MKLLSKSKFLAGGQCNLRLWYQSYRRDLATPFSPAQRARLDEGTFTGKLATKRHPDGILITENHFHHEAAVKSTQSAMTDERIPAIFEAAFTEDDVRIRVDILERAPGGRWNLIEVKSSNKVKNEHYDDVAVQYHVLKSADLDMDKAGLLHLNSEYVFDGNQLDLHDLFSFDDMTQQVRSRQEDVKQKLALYKQVVSSAEAPKILPARHCKTPFQCEFWDHCTSAMPENWVMYLYRITKDRIEQLYDAGILDISNVPADFPLLDIQERIRNCVIHQREYIDPQLQTELNEVELPLHFLDFEVFSPAIPRYANTSPYQRLPFQWSDHIISTDGEMTHSEYLHTSDTDPREDFVQTMLRTLDDRGTIFVYSPYEKSIIKSLAEHFPHLRDVLYAVIERLSDLEVIIRNHYYHPAFYGSFSIKNVLPALVPDMSYSDLAIQEGEQASLEYKKMIDPETPAQTKTDILKNLLSYCKQDSLAMVRIREELLKKL